MNENNHIKPQNVRLGKHNQLTIVREVDFGMYLDGGEIGEILLPKRYIPQNSKVGDMINVFLYLDSEERLIATTETPLIEVGQFACLEVKWTNQYGAFLDWGLMKDLFCPFKEQRIKMRQGGRYVVYCYIDTLTSRIVASAKVDKFLSTEIPPFNPGEMVNALIQQQTQLGYKAIVNGAYNGLIYQNELFQPLQIGQNVTAYIKNVRPDGKLDISLQTHGWQHVADFSEQLYDYILNTPDKFCPFHDKSDADEIYSTFKVSKRTFKKAVGDLYKRHIITIQSDGIRLTDEGRITGIIED